MNYSFMDNDNMRRDALRRTREMRRQNIGIDDVQAVRNSDMPDEPELDSSMPLREKNINSNNNGRTGSRTAHKSQKAAQKSARKSGNINGLLSGLFKDGKPDNDKIIIIALIVILAKEGADIKLLIALGYILM